MHSNPILSQGDTVFLISTSYSANKQEIDEGTNVLKNKGLHVKLGKSIFKSWGNFAGTDEERLLDLQEALNCTEAKAIICIRGGYGLSRIIADLVWTQFIQNPKWIIGFSDITLLHIYIQQLGFQSIHGLMAARFGKPKYTDSVENLFKLLFDNEPVLEYKIESDALFKESIDGKLIGGNLTMVAHTLGTDLELQFDDNILFLEEVSEPFYKIDRILYQLHLSFKANKLKAIVLGQFTNCDKLGFPLALNEIFKTAFPGIPIFFGLQSGHDAPNFPLILGGKVKIQKKDNQLNFTQWLQNEAVI